MEGVVCGSPGKWQAVVPEESMQNAGDGVVMLECRYFEKKGGESHNRVYNVPTVLVRIRDIAQNACPSAVPCRHPRPSFNAKRPRCHMKYRYRQ